MNRNTNISTPGNYFGIRQSVIDASNKDVAIEMDLKIKDTFYTEKHP